MFILYPKIRVRRERGPAYNRLNIVNAQIQTGDYNTYNMIKLTPRSGI